MLDKVQKRLESLGYKVYTNKVTGPKGDVVASTNPYGTIETKDAKVLKILKEPIAEVKAPVEEPRETVIEVVKKKVSRKK